jgi:hypothetical protein
MTARFETNRFFSTYFSYRSLVYCTLLAIHLGNVGSIQYCELVSLLLLHGLAHFHHEFFSRQWDPDDVEGGPPWRCDSCNVLLTNGEWNSQYDNEIGSSKDDEFELKMFRTSKLGTAAIYPRHQCAFERTHPGLMCFSTIQGMSSVKPSPILIAFYNKA